VTGRAAPLLAVDGGASKVDAVVMARDGSIVSAVRFVSGEHDGHLHGDYLDLVNQALSLAAARAGRDAEDRPLARLGVYCLAGADLPQDDRRILRWLGRQGWTSEKVLRNDTFAVLRAGTDRTWGVGIVCGSGTNCSGLSPDGREYRLPAVGEISGDWGGGMDIGPTALWHSLRAVDGRGDRTVLSSVVPRHFGMRRPRQVMEAMYFGRLRYDRLVELPPLVFAAAADGDAVARSIVDRQADEIATMAGAAIRKLRMRELDVHVVLGGGIFRNDFAPFFERIDEGIRRAAPRAEVVVLKAPPVLGAAMLGLDRIHAPRAAYGRVRAALTHGRLARRLAAPIEKGTRGPRDASANARAVARVQEVSATARAVAKRRKER
jgi:N-acetylglucosamine kinase-like BadF-type ATPase